MITRRLDTEERRAISSGSVYVWEERGANAEAAGVSGYFSWRREASMLIRTPFLRWASSVGPILSSGVPVV